MLWWLSPEEEWDAVHDAVGINCKKGELLNVKAEMSSIWANGCILMIVCVCVI